MRSRGMPAIVRMTIECESEDDAVSVYELLKREAKLHAATLTGPDGREQEFDRYLGRLPAGQDKTTP